MPNRFVLSILSKAKLLNRIPDQMPWCLCFLCLYYGKRNGSEWRICNWPNQNETWYFGYESGIQYLNIIRLNWNWN
jgi:hypothetical protein